MKQWYKIKNQDGKIAEIYLYDAIGGWGEDSATAKNFIKDLKAITADTIHLHINSPGGDVFDGNSIFNALLRCDQTIYTFIDGLAASMASVIALVGEKVYMAENAMYMIHNPWGICAGDEHDMIKYAELLEKIKIQMIKTYTTKTGLSEDEIAQMMDDETWLSSDEALDNGFIDEVTDKLQAAALDLSGFKYKHADKYQSKIKIKNIIKNSTKIPDEEDEQMEELLKLLGVKSEAEAIVKVKGLQDQAGKVAGLEKKVADHLKKDISSRVDALVLEGKLTEEQKDWAINLGEKSPESFEAFVKSLEEKSAPEAVYTEDEAGVIVDKAIKDKKILPAQKDSLVKMGAVSKTALDDFLKESGVVDLGTSKPLDKPEEEDFIAQYKVEVRD